MRTTLLAAGFATLLAAPLALAGEREAIAPSAPSSPAELALAGQGTVAGTVTAVAGRGFTLAELTTGEPVTVDTKHLPLTGLAPGAPVTITGTMKRGELRARHAIRGDGSVVAPSAVAEGDEEDEIEG